MGPKANNDENLSKGLYRFIDTRQPEIRWSLCVSILMEILFISVSLHNNFSLYENDVITLIEYIIAGLISLIGVAVAGIAVIIALFTSEQIKLIESLRAGAFEKLLYDFKWFAQVSAIETAIFIAMIFVIRSPHPIVAQGVFYFLTFVLTYAVFYLLFYACALIGNFIKMSHLKCSLDKILNQTKSVPVSAVELQVDFLVSKLFHGDKQAACGFYSELVDIIEQGSAKNKNEIVEYLKAKYVNIRDNSKQD